MAHGMLSEAFFDDLKTTTDHQKIHDRFERLLAMAT
jgi:hypothetical protein